MARTGLKVRYWLTLISGLLECLCFAGILFGWASLVFVLKSDGYFNYLCVNNTANGTITKGTMHTTHLLLPWKYINVQH